MFFFCKGRRVIEDPYPKGVVFVIVSVESYPGGVDPLSED